MGLSKDSSTPSINKMNQTEGCVIIMMIFTIFIALPSMSINAFPLVVALGLSTIALAILHLARSIKSN